MRNLNLLLTSLALLAITGAGCTKHAKMARHMEHADKYFADGDYDKAEIEYINVLQLDGKSARAYGRIGIMSLEQGRMARAYTPLQRACALDTNNTEFHDKLGLFYLAMGRMKEARNEANFVLDREPQNEEAPLLLADASAALNDIEASRQKLEKLNLPQAKQAAVDVALGNLAFKQRDMKSAAADYEKARAIDPKFAALHSSMAIYYWLQNDSPHADQEFKAAIAVAPLRSQIRLIYAKFKAQAGDYAGGKAILEESMQKTPDFLPAPMGLAEFAIAERKFDDAGSFLDKVLARDPDNYSALLMKGQVAMAQNQPSKAVIEFEKLTRNYKAPLAYYNLALACQAMNDVPKAIANLNQALAMNPAFTDAALALAQIKMNSGDFISAVSSLNQLIHQQPKLSSAHILLARAYEGQGKLDEAEKVYRRLEDSYPTNGQVPLLYGNLLAAQHRRADARQEYSKALELGPDYLFALEKIVDLDLEEQHYPAALDRLQKFGEKRPNTPGLSLVVAKVYLAQGDLKQAVSVLDQAINAHPDRVTAYLMLASAYGDAKDYTHALESIRKLLAKYPDNPQGQMMLATLLGDSKDSKAAEQAYEKALVQNPQNGVALNNLACLYLNDGELDKAYESAHKARDLMPREPSTADTLGWICYKRGDYEQAAPLVDESAATLSTMPEVQLHVGMAHYMLGDEDRARLSLQFAAQSKTDFPGKEMAGRSLAILDINPKTASSDARSMLEKRVAEQPADSVALRRLAAIYARDGSLDKAISNYESALKHSPKNTRVMVELARIYSAQPAGQAKALDLAKSAYKLAPNDPEVSHLFGRLAYDTGDDKLSYDLLKESARKRPGNPELQFDLAEAAYSEGRVDEAQSAMRNALQDATFSRAADAKHFLEIVPLAENASAAMAASAQIDQALKADPEYVPALMASGIISEAKNDPAAAKQAYEKALQRHPDFVRAKRRIAILSAQQPGDDKRAYDYATQAQQAFPDDPELTKVLGIITYRQGDYNRSANYLKASAAKKTDDAQLMYWLGMAQFKLHNKADSKKNLLQAIDLKLPDNMAGEAKKTLAQLN